MLICWYSLSNGMIADVVLRNLDLKFQDEQYQALMSWKRWELSQKWVVWLFADYDIRRCGMLFFIVQ